MNTSLLKKTMQVLVLLTIGAGLSACNKPSVYGSIGVSSGYSSYGGGGRMHGSISIGGRIR